MSTILDALRKVERERDSVGEGQLAGPSVSPDVRRRRPFPVMAVVICAVVGFSGGALLNFWQSRPTAVDVTSLPAPPAIDVPRVSAKAPAQPKTEGAAAKADLPKAETIAAAPAVAPVPPPAVAVASPTVAVPVAQAAAPLSAPTAGLDERVAAVGKESALEPSPFGPTRAAPARDGVPLNAALKKAPEVAPPVAKPVPPAEPEAQDLAAVEPPAELVPPAADGMEIPAEPEPEVSPESVFDTGRSPPGAPKVALSFLQWSAEPARRFAFVSIDGAPSQRVHEGEVAAGLTVAAITPTGVQFKKEGTTFVIRPRH